MKLEYVNQEDISVYFPEGRMDYPQSLVVENKITSRIKAGVSKIILDLSGLDYLCSGGVTVFNSLVRKLNEHNGKLVFCAPSPSVSNLIEMTALQSDCEVYPTLFEALLSVETEEKN
jgi:anti-anti-sigma factor